MAADSSIGNWQSAMSSLFPKRLNLYVDARRQIQLHQGIHRLRCRIENVHQTLMRSDLKLLARLLIDVRRTQNGPLVFDRGQRNRPSHTRSRALCSFDDFRRRLIEHAMIVSFKPDSDFFVQHKSLSAVLTTGYSTTSETVPAPTVRPPSRIAKR